MELPASTYSNREIEDAPISSAEKVRPETVRPSWDGRSSPSRWRSAVADWVPHVMLCKRPFVRGGRAYGCGQCLPCRINRRRVWTHRIMLEAMEYTDNAFVTLTYSDEHLPDGGSLSPLHARNFLKLLRRRCEPARIRYFLVGEYGDRTHRPHYHAALFNYPACAYGYTRYSRYTDSCCAACDNVRHSWRFGNISVGVLAPESAAYVAGYVCKKMTGADDVRLEGRNPEFARMSLRPGIGGHSVHEIADVHLQFSEAAPDVVSQLRHGGRLLPLGRYLIRRLRTATGRLADAPKETLAKMDEALFDVRMAAEAVTSSAGMRQFRDLAMCGFLLEKYRGKVARLEGRERIYRKRKDTL